MTRQVIVTDPDGEEHGPFPEDGAEHQAAASSPGWAWRRVGGSSRPRGQDLERQVRADPGRYQTPVQPVAVDDGEE